MAEPGTILEYWAPLPPSGVTGHNTGHWRTKAEPIKKYREAGLVAGKTLLAKTGWKPIANHVVIYQDWYISGAKGKAYLPRDVQNAIQALKPFIDGLVDSKLLQGDEWRFLSWGEMPKRITDAKTCAGRQGVLLKIRITDIEVSK